MPDFDLSITICSWNTLSDLRACLQSLQDAKGEANFEVIVVDNNSEDGSAEMVEQEFPWVVLHRMSKNLGFTGGHNYAIKRRSGKDVLLLNSDTVVHTNALAGLVSYAQGHPDAGILGPKLLNPNGSLQLSCRRFPNPVAALFRNTPIGKLFPNNRFTRSYLMEDFDHDQIAEVDWVSGAAFYVQEAVIDNVGIFDETYFMFCEDIDWCFRAWKGGFKVVYYPQAVITHAIGRSTDKAPNRMIGRHHRSMFRFFAKNMVRELPLMSRPFALLLGACAILLRASIFIAKNKIDNLKRRIAR